MMPSHPVANLVLGHADLALGVLKRAFDPEALGLHLGQGYCRCRRLGVGQAAAILGEIMKKVYNSNYFRTIG